MSGPEMTRQVRFGLPDLMSGILSSSAYKELYI